MHQVVGHQILEQADLPYWDGVTVGDLSCCCKHFILPQSELVSPWKIFLSNTVNMFQFLSNYTELSLCSSCMPAIDDENWTTDILTIGLWYNKNILRVHSWPVNGLPWSQAWCCHQIHQEATTLLCITLRCPEWLCQWLATSWSLRFCSKLKGHILELCMQKII